MAKVSFSLKKELVIDKELTWIVPVLESLKKDGVIDEYRFKLVYFDDELLCGVRKKYQSRGGFVLRRRSNGFNINSYADKEKALREMVELALQNNTSETA